MPRKEKPMTELTEDQRRALDRSPDIPARATDPGTRQVEVLLRAEDFDWVRALLGDEPDAPRRVDPRTGRAYVVIPEQRYERFKAFFEEDPLTPAEKRALLREAGKRAGWTDPVWDSGEAP
jgi:hypothetical protein